MPSLGWQPGASQALKGHFYSFMYFLFLFEVSWGKLHLVLPYPSDHRQGRSFPVGLGLDIAGEAVPTQTLCCQVMFRDG